MVGFSPCTTPPHTHDSSAPPALPSPRAAHPLPGAEERVSSTEKSKSDVSPHLLNVSKVQFWVRVGSAKRE